MTTLESLKKLTPYAKVNLSEIAKWFDHYAASYGVDTPARKQAFFSQAAHETDGFNTLTEYASGAAYEGRASLGNTQTGDGKKFRGRGIFQITGRTNYGSISKAIFKDNRLLESPEILATPQYAVLSALIYWQQRGLSALADKGDFQAITKKINGGLNGWADRLNYLEKAKILFLNNPVESALIGLIVIAGIYFILKYYRYGLRGN